MGYAMFGTTVRTKMQEFVLRGDETDAAIHY